MGASRYHGFGLELDCDRPVLAALASNTSTGTKRVRVNTVDYATLADRLGDGVGPVWETAFDGSPYRMFREHDGGHRFIWQGRAAFHLDPGAERLQAGFAEDSDLAARRLLLDTVLWSISLIHGYELLHASAVLHRGSAIAIVSGTGGGKTSLATQLITRGALLISDDVVALSYLDDGVFAHPGPPLMNVPLGDSASELGQVLAVFGDEAWVRIDSAVVDPLPLDAVYVLERGAGSGERLELHPRGAMALLPHAFGFPGERARLGQQLEILGDLAKRAAVLRLATPETTSPAELADLIEESLRDLPQTTLTPR